MMRSGESMAERTIRDLDAEIERHVIAAISSVLPAEEYARTIGRIDGLKRAKAIVDNVRRNFHRMDEAA